ncbi:MAG: hypothetical protein JO330_04470 [Mycobacteriaceae bacterium]|nr:hypothetical protein [Mycobacteriaceae bacterium]
MRSSRLSFIARQIGALTAVALGAVATLNGYHPLARTGYRSLVSWAWGLIVTEFPVQTLVSQLAGLALTTRLTPRVRAVAWLTVAVSALGLLNVDRVAHLTDRTLTTGLDRGLGRRRRTDSGDLWRAPGSGTAKAPGAVRMLRIYRDYAHDADISYGEFGGANRLDIWRRPDVDYTGSAQAHLQSKASMT